jgi:hypothetical protein
MWRHILFCLTVLIFLLPKTEVHCWESDTHYGLTKWLAVKAGFSLDDAEIVAAGAESADESKVFEASFIVKYFVCVGRSIEASRHVQQHHFPSDGFVPSPRKERKIIPGEPRNLNGGNLWVRQVINVKSKSKYHNTNLNRFGISLHPLGDSWSHQGIPDKPSIACREDLIWAHSKKRGGWGSHDADITHKYVDDLIASAEAVYHYMGEFLKHYPEYRNKSPEPWNKIKNHVERFAKAKTALDKEKWFDSNHDVPLKSYTTYKCFLRDTNLEDHDKIICSKKESQEEKLRKQIEGLTFKGTREIREASEFFEYFLTNWIIKGRVDNIIKETFNFSAVKNRLIRGYPEWADVNANLWFRALLSMWLVPDHGHVNELGHGMPFPNKKGFETLSYKVIKELKSDFKSLSDAIYFPGTYQPYQIIPLTPDKDGLRVASVFRFHHTPRDMLIFIASKVRGRWKITGMSWIII